METNFKILHTSYNCDFKNRLRLEYDRELDRIILKPCCNIYPININEEPFSYNSEYFLENINDCLQKYSEFDMYRLYKYYDGRCTNDSKLRGNLRNTVCKNYDGNKIIETIEVSTYQSCNLKCKMCNLHLDKNNKELYIYKKLMDYFCNKDYKIISTSLGEPFLFKNEMLNWIKNCKEMYVITNATLLDTEYIIKLSRYSNKFKLAVSLDSIKKEIYERIRVGANFEKTMENLLLLKKFNLLDQVLCCVQSDNITERKLVEDWSILENITVNYLYDLNSNNKEYYLNNWIDKEN